MKIVQSFRTGNKNCMTGIIGIHAFRLGQNFIIQAVIFFFDLCLTVGEDILYISY